MPKIKDGGEKICTLRSLFLETFAHVIYCWQFRDGTSVVVPQCYILLCPCVFGLQQNKGWSGGAMVLGKLPVPGRPTILITVGQGPTALAVGAGGGCLGIFILLYPFSSFSLSLGVGPI